MSTRVEREEWGTLEEVPVGNWSSFYGGSQLGPCDIQPSHGRAKMFWQTPDHRALAVCNGCDDLVRQARLKAKAHAQGS